MVRFTMLLKTAPLRSSNFTTSIKNVNVPFFKENSLFKVQAHLMYPEHIL